jgi:hypothetical protein
MAHRRRSPLEGGWIMDALGWPCFLDLEAYVRWSMAGERLQQETGWHPTWIAKSVVGRREVSTVFLSILGELGAQPFETWVSGPGVSAFYRYHTAHEASAGRWCLVWQYQEGEPA